MSGDNEKMDDTLTIEDRLLLVEIQMRQATETIEKINSNMIKLAAIVLGKDVRKEIDSLKKVKEKG